MSTTPTTEQTLLQRASAAVCAIHPTGSSYICELGRNSAAAALGAVAEWLRSDEAVAFLAAAVDLTAEDGARAATTALAECIGGSNG